MVQRARDGGSGDNWNGVFQPPAKTGLRRENSPKTELVIGGTVSIRGIFGILWKT